MDYAKLKDGALEYAPKGIELEGGAWQIPPSAEWMAENGFKLVTYTEQPEPEEGYYYESGWEETDTEIVQTWTKKELPEPEPDPIEAIFETLDFILENMEV